MHSAYAFSCCLISKEIAKGSVIYLMGTQTIDPGPWRGVLAHPKRNRGLGHKLRSAQVRAWLIPLAYAVSAVATGFTVPRISGIFLPQFASTMSAAAAIGVYSAIASGMIALTGIVFSLTFVMVQFSATAFSPRLGMWIARDPVLAHALGMFTATFLYALTALAWVDRNSSGRVPLVSLWMVVLLMLASIVMFISLIHRVGTLQVNRMLIFTGDRGRTIIAGLYPPIEVPATSGPNEIDQMPCTQTVFHRGDPQFVQAVDVAALVELAKQSDSLIEILAAVGDSVLESTPILRVLGGSGHLSGEDLLNEIDLGNERTFEQDPKYAIRLLVDIAIKALSPAINDPTTAVQALDQIEDLLLRLGRRRLEIGTFRDDRAKIRVLVPFPSWDDFLRLAFDEIRFYGANSVQVMRRMKALVSELMSLLPKERAAALKYWQERIKTTVDHSFRDNQERLDASVEDRQGLGISRPAKSSD